MTNYPQPLRSCFPSPHARSVRFSQSLINEHCVFAIPPGTDPEEISGLIGNLVTIDECFDRDLGADEAGFPVGTINDTTILEISNADGQDWIDQFDLTVIPRIWTPHARYYFFEYAEPDDLQFRRDIPGVRLLNDGDWIPYPGSLVEEQLVHWEIDTVGFYPLLVVPEEFRVRPHLANM